MVRLMTKRLYVTVDRRAGAAYISLIAAVGPGEVANTVEGAPNINLDFDAQGRLLGIELLSLALLHPMLLPADDPLA
jgi:uncharacterized protein YuzE